MAKYNKEIVYCKDCIHRPKKIYEEDNCVLILEFPDYKCICRCEDNYYSVYPENSFYCGYGEDGEDKKDKEENELVDIVVENTAKKLQIPLKFLKKFIGDCK
jgi:hypothetical protein